MERLSKPERIGLFSFAIIIAAFLAINHFIKDGGYTAKPLTPEETAKMEQFILQVEKMKADTIVRKPSKQKEKTQATPPANLNPLSDPIERNQ